MYVCIHTHIYTYIKEVEFSLEQATKAQREKRCIALLFLQLRNKMGVGGQCFNPGKEPVPIV